MKPTLLYLHKMFGIYNREYFKESLPLPRFNISLTKSWHGLFHVRAGIVTIKISSLFECSEKEINETLLHEMIHYYIWYHKIQDNGSHGWQFRSLMHDINRSGHFNISIRSKIEIVKTEGVKTYNILKITDKTKGIFLFVVNENRIQFFLNLFRESKTITEFGLYVSKNEYFKAFRECRTNLTGKRFDFHQTKEIEELNLISMNI